MKTIAIILVAALLAGCGKESDFIPTFNPTAPFTRDEIELCKWECVGTCVACSNGIYCTSPRPTLEDAARFCYPAQALQIPRD